MAINTQKVLTGGLVAGVVMTGLDFLTNGVILADQNRAAMDAINPELAANMEGASSFVGVIVIDVLLGILLVWTYAAMRPRFGAGPKTAVAAGFQVWLVAGLMFAFLALVGMYTWRFFALGLIVALVMFVAAALAGGMVYKEE